MSEKNNPLHIPDEVYARLNDQIDSIQQGMENGVKRARIQEEMDGANITVDIELHAKSSRSKFRDDAWGHPKTFTEISSTCEIEILAVAATDETGQATESDFDEDMIETSYEYTEWK